jgi:hypothetical protein
MNRVGLGLAIGAGYVLGRTKKAKMALAVGSLVAGKRLNLSPRMVADLVNQQLKNNPQFKELGDQLRGDLKGAGKAASGALVERQIGALADRLHSRTAEMRGEGTGGSKRGKADAGDEAETEDEAADERDEAPEEEAEDSGESEKPRRSGDSGGARRGSAGERGGPAKKAAKSAQPAKKAAKKAAGRKGAPPAAKKAPGDAAKKAASARKAAAKTAGRGRQAKGGGEQ